MFFPGLSSLGAPVRCVQNRYTAVQIDLKYNVAVDGFQFFVTFVLLSSRCDFTMLSLLQR